MNENILNYVELRLEEWVDWYSRGNCYGIGFPSCSIEYRLMKEGVLVKKTSAKSLNINVDAEEIEKLVNEMSVQNRNMALALRCHYFMSGGLRAKAEKVNISHMQFKYYVDMAHQWLVGRFSGEKRELLKYSLL